MLKSSDWECVNDTRSILSDADSIQHLFSYENKPTLWRAIPAFEELQTAWEGKRALQKYDLYKDALDRALQKLGKYYSKFDEKNVYVLALGKFHFGSL